MSHFQIVKALAACNPLYAARYYSDSRFPTLVNRCVLCLSESTPPSESVRHSPTCPWKMAKTAVANR
jgi:hypothetical protein